MVAEPTNPYWPHNYDPKTVAYTGTHDNDTTNGWYAGLDDGAKWRLGRYLGKPVTEPNWEMIRLAWLSVAELAVTPLQDVLGLGREGRMNVPGVATGNWGWRFRPDQFRGGEAERLRDLTELSNRLPAAG
jgi:4-alpha-glucanotransferase